MSGTVSTMYFRWLSPVILLAVAMIAAAPQAEASSLFNLGAGHGLIRDSEAVIWDHPWNLTGNIFFDLRPGIQLGLTMGYYFLEPRPACELFGVGVMWEKPDDNGWMFSLLPSIRIPFSISEDGSTQVYVQGGAGWYHIEMDVLFSGQIPGSAVTDVEKRITAKWDKPGMDCRFGVVSRLGETLILEISPGVSVIFTDDESTWSLNGYIAVGLAL